MTTSTIWAKGKQIGIAAGVAFFWLAVWQLVAAAVAQELLVPAPLAVLQTLWEMVQTTAFWSAATHSLLRVTAGFLSAVAAGVLLAVLTVRFRVAARLLSPLLHIVRAAPVASFIILAFVWIRTNTLPGFIAFLMVVPVVWANVEKGIRETDRRLLEMADVYRIGTLRTLLHVRIPAVMPYFLTACTTGLGFAWKSGIAAEVICRPDDSLGRLLQTAKMHLETAEVFAYTAVAVALSILLERLLLAAARRFGRRYNVE